MSRTLGKPNDAPERGSFGLVLLWFSDSLLFMKKLVWKAFAGLMLASVLCGSAQAQTRIGTVDLRKVFDKYWKRQQADAAIKAHVADLRKQFDSMYNDY